ncbi:MlaA family lipoprotein [Helicobacter sp. WB40]|uniref:MlaA family lipoprotein n=1 Tax=Helicobacter sp. WB40 TaxID=3004130 RepID=UPI0022EBD332|nr:VacJ family lipoprotein [Helicobacter sp. WB40]MDA3966447.1 VacJ family lipoprotein [Helicobacter sp. WB40]
MKNIISILLLVCSLQNISYANLSELEEFEEEYIQAVNDPLENYNRFMSDVNWQLYDYVFSPMLDVYNTVVPLGFRMGVYNFFNNLFSPLNILTNLLSFRMEETYNEVGRFALNSTVGIFGVFDIATSNGLYANKSDFGVLFGRYGFGSGFYLVLPILGPSNLRDSIAMPLDSLIYPINYLDPFYLSVGVRALKEINYFVVNKPRFDEFRKDSSDSYLLIRDSYEQYRDELIRR